MRTKHTFRLPPDLAAQLADYAHRKRVPQALVVETALSSHLSPDSSERMEAALGRRLDRLTRQVERLERHSTISNEALARAWPAVSEGADPGAGSFSGRAFQGRGAGPSRWVFVNSLAVRRPFYAGALRLL
jgi:hypothetical protein